MIDPSPKDNTDILEEMEQKYSLIEEGQKQPPGCDQQVGGGQAGRYERADIDLRAPSPRVEAMV